MYIPIVNVFIRYMGMGVANWSRKLEVGLGVGLVWGVLAAILTSSLG